jgi:hypothetical protein
MTDEQPPSGGRMRTSTRQQSAPAGKGWDPMERCDWAAVAAVLPTPWPLGAQRHDLRYWASRQRAHEGDRPGYRALAERWGVSEKAARVVCADVEWWADPRFGDEDPKRAHEGRTKGAAGAHEGRTKGAPDHVADDVLNVKGRTKGAAGAHEGRTKGAAGAPKDNSNTNHNHNTDTREHMSAPPPPAGAGQPLLFGGQVEEPVKVRPPAEKTARAEEARRLMARLEALRLTRHKGRGLTEKTWLPKLTAALAKRSAQSIVDGYVWLLRSPGAAFQRGEDGKGGTDYTQDYATLLAHSAYADRRSWRGREGPLTEELADWREAAAAVRPAPEWVQRWRAADRAACELFERGMMAAAGVVDDDDIW